MLKNSRSRFFSRRVLMVGLVLLFIGGALFLSAVSYHVVEYYLELDFVGGGLLFTGLASIAGSFLFGPHRKEWKWWGKTILVFFFVGWGAVAGLWWYFAFLPLGFIGWAIIGFAFGLCAVYMCSKHERRAILQRYLLDEDLMAALAGIVVLDVSVILAAGSSGSARLGILVGIIVMLALTLIIRKTRGEPLRRRRITTNPNPPSG